MTQHLLNSSLRDGYELVHFNLSKGRTDMDTKAKFDLVNVFFGLVQPFALGWAILRHRPDAIYTNLAQNRWGFLRYASFIWTAWLFRTPVVTRVMGEGFGHFYRSTNLRWLVDATVRRIDRVIVRAELLKKQFEGVIPLEKLRVIYSGIRVEEFERPDLKEDRPGVVNFLFVGYLSQAKGAFDILRVLPEVVAEEPDVMFRFMGPRVTVERNVFYIDDIERPPNDVLEELEVHEAVRSHARFLGVLSGDAKVREFVSADVLVFPSHSEAFPTVVLEGMAAGLPVIATPVGALPEAFDDRGILFNDPGDTAALKESILRIARDDRLRRDMGRHNYEEVRRNFTVDCYGARVRALFDELLGTDAGSGGVIVDADGTSP
ncbi:MAG: glycosyltransferase family 4 protein [Akkermansiaceae bacterium]|nr:glycosyltransferase family 4 protein [Akkermansiaceae bacterium]